MSVVALKGNDPVDLSQDVINAVVEYFFRWGRAPRVVIATSNDDLRVDLGDELRARGFDVVEAAHARTLHAALLRSMNTPEQHAVDLFVVDNDLDGCSPLHAIGYARQQGFSPATVLLTEEDDLARIESTRMDLAMCSREHALAGIDRALLRVLTKRWSERPVAA
jgi:CheY-like chemotaxis protein